MIQTTETQVRLFASSRSRVGSRALRQLYAAARLDGMRLAVGFPDLHPGRTAPVGAAFRAEGRIYPHLIGGDIGCGMALFKTDLNHRHAKPEAWAERRFQLEHQWEGSVNDYVVEQGLEATEFDERLGTIGGGNHFAEVQAVDEVHNASALRRFGLGTQQLVLLVHSGSRGVGTDVLRRHLAQHLDAGVEPGSPAGRDYLRGHDFALRWAKANRKLIARRFASALGATTRCIWDGCHNSIQCRSGILPDFKPLSPKEGRGGQAGSLSYVHRRGAVSAAAKAVMIPGSRGSLSYLVKPVGDGASHAWSLAHGAGRRWARTVARLRMRERFGARQLVQTPLGGRVICEERNLLYEEAPQAYKNIEDVIGDLVEAGLISVIATFRPILTYKTRKLRR